MRHNARNWFGRVNNTFSKTVSLVYSTKPLADPRNHREAVIRNNTERLMYHFSINMTICRWFLSSCVCSWGGLSAMWPSIVASIVATPQCCSLLLPSRCFSKALSVFSLSVHLLIDQILFVLSFSVSWCLAWYLCPIRRDLKVLAGWRHKQWLSHTMQCFLEFIFTNQVLFHFIK